MKKLLLVALVAVLIVGTATFASANLITDPSFESWSSDTNLNNWSESNSVTRSTYSRTGTYSAYLSDASLLYNQSVGVLSSPFNITQTGVYEFGAYFAFVSSADPTSISGWPDERYGVTANLEFNAIKYPNLIYSVPSQVSVTWSYDNANQRWVSDWYLINFTADITSLGVGKLNIYLQNYDTSTSSGAFVDDAYGAPVPEPATMLLLGSGLVGLVGLGRNRFFKKA